METQIEDASEARSRRLNQLDRITAVQLERNSDLTEEVADALIQRYLAEDRDERTQPAHMTGNHR
jgi:hypothetical protein